MKIVTDLEWEITINTLIYTYLLFIYYHHMSQRNSPHKCSSFNESETFFNINPSGIFDLINAANNQTKEISNIMKNEPGLAKKLNDAQEKNEQPKDQNQPMFQENIQAIQKQQIYYMEKKGNLFNFEDFFEKLGCIQPTNANFAKDTSIKQLALRIYTLVKTRKNVTIKQIMELFQNENLTQNQRKSLLLRSCYVVSVLASVGVIQKQNQENKEKQKQKKKEKQKQKKKEKQEEREKLKQKQKEKEKYEQKIRINPDWRRQEKNRQLNDLKRHVQIREALLNEKKKKLEKLKKIAENLRLLNIRNHELNKTISKQSKISLPLKMINHINFQSQCIQRSHFSVSWVKNTSPQLNVFDGIQVLQHLNLSEVENSHKLVPMVKHIPSADGKKKFICSECQEKIEQD